MMGKPLISVVMPAHNAEKHIKKAIESILGQTFKNFELIIVNDASTDKTLSIIKSYARRDPRIRVVNNRKNLDIARSLNKGIEVAKSEIIARMDADDISLPNRLEVQHKAINSSKRIAVVGANIVVMDPKEKDISARSYPENSKDLKACFFKYSPFAHPVVMFRKKIFDKVGRYNPEYSPTEDLDLWFRMGIKHEFKSVPQLLLRYRLSEASSSHSIIRRLEMLVFRIRIKAIIKYGYRPNVFDVIYNIMQFLTLWFTPSLYRIKIYNLLRSNGII